MKVRTLGIGIFVVFCCFSALLTFASKKGRNLDKSEVATTWIGLDRGETAAYRLQLDPGGAGAGAMASARDEPPVVFGIASWTYQNGKIRIVGEPVLVGDTSYSPYFTGEVIGTRLKLVDKGDDWKIRVELRRESEMLDWLERLQQSMAKLEI